MNRALITLVCCLSALVLCSCADDPVGNSDGGDITSSADDVPAPDSGVATADTTVGQAAQPLGLKGLNEPGGVCATVADAPCGGDIMGTWELVDFCTPEPAGDHQPCEGPGEDEPACAGDASSRICNILYGGTAEFTADALAATFSVAARVRYSFTDPCLAALGEGAEGQAACDARVTDKLACDYADGTCSCEAVLDPQSELQTVAMSLDGHTMTLEQGGKEAVGTYCVDGDRLTIVFDPHGPQGWRAWVLDRVQ